MKKILIPTDFSDNAHNALKYAASIAEKIKSQVIIFNFFRIPIVSGDVPIDPSLIEELENESIESLQQLKKDVLEKHPDLDIKCISSSGLDNEVNEICETSDSNGIDLVVMGTKGASGITKAVIGSNTAHVIDDSHCPVLAIPEFATFKGIKKIIYATDFNSSDYKSIRFLKEMASDFDAEIIVVHIAAENHSLSHEANQLDQFKQELGKYTSLDKITFEVIGGEDIAERLNKLIDETGADIISMSTRKRNLYQRLFDRSMTKKMAYHTHVPLLAFHIQ
jgi:nucleotide-binding universal stress UspA family protein